MSEEDQAEVDTYKLNPSISTPSKICFLHSMALMLRKSIRSSLLKVQTEAISNLFNHSNFVAGDFEMTQVKNATEKKHLTY